MYKYIFKKEFLLVFRNLHAVGVLFIMPMAFILIMSLALKDTYSNKLDTKLEVLLVTEISTKSIDNLAKNLNKNNFFNINTTINKIDKKELLYDKSYDFIVKLPNKLFKALHEKQTDFKIDIYTRPDIEPQRLALLKNFLIKSISSIYVKGIIQMQTMGADITFNLEEKIKKHYIYKSEDFQVKPTSVQQSVPAWLVFSMFFILIPISNTFIQEKDLGTIDRIKSINISLWPIIIGKMLPYYIINQVQVILMILIGIYLVPLLGGDSLVISGNIFLIFLISSVLSFTAISFALFISNISKTTEEATSIGGLSNIILAALGGVMVPKVVMPQFMQEITEYSPMSWALESFLEVFVRGGGVEDIYLQLLNLIAFGIVSLLIAYILLKRKTQS